MPHTASANPDKNIVDRTQSRPNRAVARAVRATRARLQTGRFSNAVFEKEMMRLHLDSVVHNSAGVALTILLAAAFGMWLAGDLALAAWMAMALSLQALCIVVAWRARKVTLTQEQVAPLRRQFILLQGLTGVSWAIFALQDCSACRPDLFEAYHGGALLIGLAATAMGTVLLRPALIATFLPVIGVLALRAVEGHDLSTAALAAAIAVALLFLLVMTNRMQQANLRILAIQSEKDDLIAELEVAKSMSDEARRRAEDANLAKSRFLASMSHELRTPLNAILGFSEVMHTEVLGPLDNPIYKEYSGDIHRSGQHLLDLINEILDLSRIEAGRYELHEEAVHLLEIVEDCMGMVQLRARSKNIQIRHQAESAMPALWADEKAIRQITLNLLSNAVKFTPAGGEILVKVGWTAGGGQYVSIRDNGPGIPEEEIPVVLSAFGQGSIAIKSAEQGTGLGLPIVQALLAKHGGEFLLRSKLREGTEAIAILPSKRVLDSLPAVRQVQPVERRRRSFA
ncbi:two-component sensor histidine kinase [Rhizobium rhizosphaerae]|uniref:histidine kinase n=1 Tax=Xaviernesmea rhizosphaerae TaxID=1672749 RepID=A0A1Q9AMT7_9HYPH|nr:HAMP domain-containing sensor histidine kinase [Xaviernesmea rhizosphaerae]OLP56704.1 two-component sensor histidine kinase [Xaviernesmea rhizosphaerae]OQP88346.1 two-component sensor histidine kinase [Xaviernesmea rhizosphaerae]